MTPRPRVLLADDHRATAQSLREVLEPACEVIAIVEDGLALVEAAATLRPDAIVTDVMMPRLDGVLAAQRILDATPSMPIVFVSVLGERAMVARALAIGARGYVLKNVADEDLLPAVLAALDGRTPTSDDSIPAVERWRTRGSRREER